MFLDEATIEVRGGRGGDGCKGFRREKYIPYGGPDGGDGGKGGDVILVADENADTLSDFASRKRFEAPKGSHGLGKKMGGKNGEDMVLLVPPGTTVTEILTDESGKRVERHLGDLLQPGQRMRAARGGRGGYGNAHFKSSTRQAPDFAELGEPGELRGIRLDLKLVADAGIIGYPSVGKSTLISVISAARPKIAAYHFTTLVPNLGVVTVSKRSYVVCDVPGLIEGASEGKGLGDKFLRHIERTGVLLHLLDIERALREGGEVDPAQLIADYKAIRKELEAYSPLLAHKRELVVLSKADLVGEDTAVLVKALKKAKITVWASISSATRFGIEDLTKRLLKIVLDERHGRIEAEAVELDRKSAEVPVLQPHLEMDRMDTFTVKRDTKGIVRVKGARLEQFTVMTNFDNVEAVNRFRDVLDRVGVRRALKKVREVGDPVYIGAVRVDEFLE